MSPAGQRRLESPIGVGSALVQGRGRRRLCHALILDGGTLWHYQRRLDRPDRPWLRQAVISTTAVAAADLLETQDQLIAVVPEASGSQSYRLGRRGWLPVAGVPKLPSPLPVPGLCNSLASEAVVSGFTGGALVAWPGALFSYHQVRGHWEPDACLWLRDPEPFQVATGASVKLAQLTGEVDATPSPGGLRRPTLSSSRSTAGIRGTDLGVRVDHAGRTFLLFGDTHWTRPWLATRDSIAEVLPGEQGLPQLRFHGSPLKVSGWAAGRVTMREYDVPLDGFSHAGQLYGLFTSNHFRSGRVMGRSVLTRARRPDLPIDPAARRDPARFEALGTFSDRHFINASVQLVPARSVPGFGTESEILLVWGTGAYRASEPRLAVLDQAALARLEERRPRWRPRPNRIEGLKYWTPSGWSEAEADAAPIVRPAALGELSVRWVPELGRYLMLSAAAPGDPAGPAILLRTAGQPWGPWSPRLRLMDWIVTGMSPDPHRRFIKASRIGDPVGDRVFRAQARSTGAAYAPYLFDVELDGSQVSLRYTLSTWNPYQVILMQHRLALAELD